MFRVSFSPQLSPAPPARTPFIPARMPPETASVGGTAHAQGQLDGVGNTKLDWQSWQPTKVKKRGVLVVMHGLKDHSSRYADTLPSD